MTDDNKKQQNAEKEIESLSTEVQEAKTREAKLNNELENVKFALQAVENENTKLHEANSKLEERLEAALEAQRFEGFRRDLLAVVISKTWSGTDFNPSSSQFNFEHHCHQTLRAHHAIIENCLDDNRKVLLPPELR